MYTRVFLVLLDVFISVTGFPDRSNLVEKVQVTLVHTENQPKLWKTSKTLLHI